MYTPSPSCRQPLEEVGPDRSVKAWTGTLGNAGLYLNSGVAEARGPGLDSWTPADLGKHTALFCGMDLFV